VGLITVQIAPAAGSAAPHTVLPETCMAASGAERKEVFAP